MIEQQQNLENIVAGRWPEQWFLTPQVNEEYDRVRRISKTHVVKLPRNYLSLGILYKEFKIQELAYLAGLSVPKPEGIFEVKIRDRIFAKKRKGVVMEYVPGILLEDLKGTDIFFKAKNQRDMELEKAEMLGFTHFDAICYLNSIWNPEKQRIYLIDFESWGFRK